MVAYSEQLFLISDVLQAKAINLNYIPMSLALLLALMNDVENIYLVYDVSQA